jgi:hypothetical protein
MAQSGILAHSAILPVAYIDEALSPRVSVVDHAWQEAERHVLEANAILLRFELVTEPERDPGILLSASLI